jgi:hypothetical protein
MAWWNLISGGTIARYYYGGNKNNSGKHIYCDEGRVVYKEIPGTGVTEDGVYKVNLARVEAPGKDTVYTIKGNEALLMKPYRCSTNTFRFPKTIYKQQLHPHWNRSGTVDNIMFNELIASLITGKGNGNLLSVPQVPKSGWPSLSF